MIVLIVCSTPHARTTANSTASIGGLPRFYMRGRGKTETEYEVSNSVRDPLEQMILALDPDVPDGDWYVYERVFAWDENLYLLGDPSASSSAPDQPASPVAQGVPGFRTVRWGAADLSAQRIQGLRITRALNPRSQLLTPGTTMNETESSLASAGIGVAPFVCGTVIRDTPNITS